MSEQAAPGGAKKFNWSAISVIVAAAMSAGGTAWAVNRSYFELIADVREIKLKNAAQDERMGRIEQTQAQDKSDMKEQLNTISTDVRQVRDILLTNSANSRPDIKRWAR